MKRIELDIELIRRQHWDDERPIKDIAKDLGVSRACVYANLRRAGVPWRDTRASTTLWNKKLGTEGRQINTAAAHAAVRGTKRTIEDKEARAKRVEALAKLSPLESVFREVLIELGYPPDPQKAVGIYNIDLAMTDYMIAVEIDPGNWHNTTRKAEADRAKDRYLQEHGWRIIRISGKPIRMSNRDLWSTAFSTTVQQLRALGLRPLSAFQDTPSPEASYAS